MSSYHYILGPIVALAALGLIILICRWVFSTTTRDQRVSRQAEKALSAGDYGLLVPVASTTSPGQAEQLRLALRAAGIRGTVAPGDGPQLLVLVFRADEARARDVVSSSA